MRICFRSLPVWVFFLLSAAFTRVSAQENEMGNRKLQISLNDSGTHFVRFTAYFQVWGRYTQENPGTLVDGQPVDHTFDISLRRFRVSASGMLTKKLFFFVQAGDNNLNYLTARTTSFRLLDAYAEYRYRPWLEVGGGKNLWTGLSRFAAPSTSKNLGYDFPMVAIPTVNITNDLLRTLNVYAKGNIGDLHYRAIISTPPAASSGSGFSRTILENEATFRPGSYGVQSSGYVKWMFFDREPADLPFHSGTYLGAKKMLNIGAGFLHQPRALWWTEGADTVVRGMDLFAADVFAEIPTRNKRHVFTSYLAFYQYDLGKNYLRNLAVNNPANGLDGALGTLNGSGDGYPVAGTGQSVFVQGGWLIPPFKNKSLGRLQPNADFQIGWWDKLDEPMQAYDLGVAWLLHGHLARFALNFQNRPIFIEENGQSRLFDRRWIGVLAFQWRLE